MKKLYISLGFFSIDSENSYPSSIDLFLKREFLQLTGKESFVIRKEKKGKPLIKTPSGFYVSIAHSAEFGVIVLANFKVGIDLELLSERRNFKGIADEFFTQDEIKMLEEKGTDAVEAFYLLWTRKEAWIKREGLSVWDMGKCGNMNQDHKWIKSWMLKRDGQKFAMSLALDYISPDWGLGACSGIALETLDFRPFPL